MRYIFTILALIISFESYPEMPDPEIGLPQLASEDDIRLNQKRRSKVLTQSVARKVTTIVEALDEAGLIEDEKNLLIKAKKPEEAKAKDEEIARLHRVLEEKDRKIQRCVETREMLKQRHAEMISQISCLLYTSDAADE